jgi:DNA (cytosine-5)-methyltransferase 1
MWKNYLTIKEASDFLGLSAQTLRNWEKNGKLKTFRHPSNGYRLYPIPLLEKILKTTKKHRESKSKFKLAGNS